MKILQTGRQIGRTLKNASRLRTIVGVFARHGFHNIAERIRLGRFLLERLSGSDAEEKYSVAERVRMSFEELGPTFVKLGQLLAARPDLVPEDFVNEFAKLHDKVNPLSFEVIEGVLKEEFGESLYKKFESFDPNPLGSASIAQAHLAKLKDGRTAVIKVQRPGIIQTINEDLSVLFLLAELLEKYVEETRAFNPVAIVEEYFKTLELETNFIVEANNIKRFATNFASDPNIKIPEVFFDVSTERVLTMEAMPGISLSSDLALKQPGVDADLLIKAGIKAYLKMVFHDGFFHGDLHAGNFFVMPGNQIGLIDFGVVGRLNSRTQGAVANILLALAKEDYDLLAYEYINLAPFDERANVDLFAKDLRDLIAPYYGLTSKNVNMGKILLQSSGVASKHHLQLPSELMLFFKSLVSIEGLGKRIKDDFDALQYTLPMVADVVQAQYDPQKVIHDLTKLGRESKQMLSALPRQLSFLLRKINSPKHSFRLRIDEIQDLRRTVQTSFNLLFQGIVIASLILSASLIYVHDKENLVAGVPLLSFIGYLIAAFLGIGAFFNYIRK